jgi:hypothetical protein
MQEKRLKRSLPDLVCCRCKTVYGKGQWNKQDCDAEPCAECFDIVKRQREAKKRKQVRASKKYFGRFLKFLILLEEKEKDGELWTRRRYVSQHEIDSLAEVERKNREKLTGEAVKKTSSPWDYWLIVADTGVYSEIIDGPGFYRARQLTITKGPGGWLEPCFFSCACSGGVPTADRNHTVQRVDRAIKERYEKGAEKKRNAMLRIIERKQRERIALDNWSKAKIDNSSVPFFRALAMASVASG